jgi:hypothetical protein
MVNGKPPEDDVPLLVAFLMPRKGLNFMGVRCEIKNYNVLKKKIKDMQKAPAKVMNNLTSDAQKRVPGWVATEVAKEYGVKKGEITGQKIGKVRVESNGGVDVRIVYTGRVLTPTHFNMSPKSPKPGGGYTLKYKVVDKTQSKVKKLTKKQRKALSKNFTGSGTQTSDHSPIMLMPTGTTYIPFQRKSVRRNDVEAIKTLSLPQMVSSKRTEEGIQRAINEGLGKRLDHHMNRYMG